MTVAPTITTDRLILRGHRASDMEIFWDFYQTPRADLMDKPSSRTHLWYGLMSEVGSWVVQGHGGWAVDLPDGTMIGQVAILHPPHFAETELGWLLIDGYEGQGYAHEAAKAALDYARDTVNPPSLVSYIHRDNARSKRLAERLGATPDPTAKAHDDEDIVYRHFGEAA